MLQHAAHVSKERIQQRARHARQYLCAYSVAAWRLGSFTHPHFQIESSDTFGQRQRSGTQSEDEAHAHREHKRPNEQGGLRGDHYVPTLLCGGSVDQQLCHQRAQLRS